MPSHYNLTCLACSHETPASRREDTCPNCGSEWQEARYDYAQLAAKLPTAVASRPFNAWRYQELLPLRNPANIVTLGEGGTPLVRADNLAMMLGCSNIYIKDERQGPTGSFKDRQATVGMSMLKEQGITEAVIASTGNVAISYSAYSARAGIKLWAFLTSMVPPDKMRETALYGTQVIKVTGTYDRAKQLAADFAKRRGLFYDRGARDVAPIESMKTIAFEITEQLALQLGPQPAPGHNGRALWRAPDWYIQSVSGGLGPLGVFKAFWELREMGLIDRIPKLGLIQTEGCAPMVQAFKAGLEVAEPVTNPRTHIATLSTGNPGYAYTRLRELVVNYGGEMEAVSDAEAFRAMHVLAQMEGLATEPAAAVAFAGLFKLVRSEAIVPDEVVVVNCTGHTIPVEREILGEGWVHDVVLSGAVEHPLPKAETEGILAALGRLDERVHSVVIVDDNPDAARLVGRILQAQRDYAVHIAHSGREGLELIHARQPDLIILDLMMPEMDGFQVLDALQDDERLRDIPVIVISAKELTRAERKRLGGQIDSLLEKGSFMDEDLLTEVMSALT